MLQDNRGGIIASFRPRNDFLGHLLPGIGIVLVDHQVNRDIVRPVALVNRRDADVPNFCGKM